MVTNRALALDCKADSGGKKKSDEGADKKAGGSDLFEEANPDALSLLFQVFSASKFSLNSLPLVVSPFSSLFFLSFIPLCSRIQFWRPETAFFGQVPLFALLLLKADAHSP